tara:strand:- start:218 stop:475 length:258 start_codon:yes stop_codon:yes gene_type:complete
MTNVINLDPTKTEMISILKEKIADVSAGKVTGIAIICEYQEQYSLDMPGEFAGDVGSISELVGRLQIVSQFMCSLAIETGVNEYE